MNELAELAEARGALDPERTICSTAHKRLKLLREGCTMSKRSISTPCCCRAGAYGTNGGATQATHFFGLMGSTLVNAFRAGINKASSPTP